jgi:hypothetical protein
MSAGAAAERAAVLLRTGRRARRLARTAAHEFLLAFLAYERGRRGHAITRALTGTTTPELGRTLRAAPPRRAPGRPWSPPARLRRLTAIGPSSGHVKALAELDRGGRREVLELRLQQRRGHWRIAELG